MTTRHTSRSRICLLTTGIIFLLILVLGGWCWRPNNDKGLTSVLSGNDSNNDGVVLPPILIKEKKDEDQGSLIVEQKSSTPKEPVLENDTTADILLGVHDWVDAPMEQDKDIEDMSLLPQVTIHGIRYAIQDFLSLNNSSQKNQSSSSSVPLTTTTTTITVSPSTIVLPLPTPIIVVGMPKAGTTSITDFFNRSGYNTNHFLCLDSPLIHCGLCIRDAVNRSLPPLHTCGPSTTVWSQIDVEYPPDRCHFPQIVNLPELHSESPHSTLLLNRRNMTLWMNSVKGWSRHMDERLAGCDHGPRSANTSDMIQWHVEHIYRIRQFVKDHPSHALVEFDIADETTGGLLATLFQTSATHWGTSNSNAVEEEGEAVAAATTTTTTTTTTAKNATTQNATDAGSAQP
jgi:hypothetical protein